MHTVVVIVAIACYLELVSAGSSSCDIGQYWQKIPGGLTWVSSGDAGVWGVNSADSIFYREGSYVGSPDLKYSVDGRNYGLSTTDGTSWTQVYGWLRQIDVGKNIVWGVNGGSQVFYRKGISRTSPAGADWQFVDGLSASSVSVSDVDAKVWAVEKNTGNVYRRIGISDELPGGSSWEFVPGITSVTSIDVGGAGVWATTANGNIYYRTGSRSDCQGSGWVQVQGSLQQIASGGDTVWGVQSNGNIFFRSHLTLATPTGWEWLQVPGTLKQVSVASTTNGLWGVQLSGDIWTRHQ